ncbi:MAG: DUF1049 domain-containing protein [Deltaproteobacteria bacterium]|nr:MAG: DUF1049 domain-containing protein [Deltaproteobacteria bacterium]
MGLRLLLLLIIIVAIGFTHISILNPESVTFTIAPSTSFKVNLAELVLISFAAGALIVLIGTIVRDSVESAKRWKEKRKLARREAAREKIEKSRSSFFQEKYKSALEQVNSALKIIPESREALLLKVRILEAMGNIPEKISTLREYVRAHPKLIEGYVELARSYEETGDLSSAIETLKPLSASGEHSRVMKYLRDLYIKTGSFQEAYDIQKSLVKKKVPLSEEDLKVWRGLRFERARFLFEKGNFGEAESLLKKIIEEKEDFTPPYVLLHEIYRKQDKYEDSLEILSTGYRKTKNPVTLIKLEDLVIDNENPSDLLNLYDEFLRENPSDFSLLIFYGKFLLRLEMVDEALEQFLKAESLDTDNSSVHIFLAEAYKRRNRLTDALNEYEKAFAYKKRYLVPFVCPHCGDRVIRWSPLCEKCGHWDTYRIDFGDTRHLRRLHEEAVRKVSLSHQS